MTYALHTKRLVLLLYNIMINLSEHGCLTIDVICDDIDVFVLLVYFYNEK